MKNHFVLLFFVISALLYSCQPIHSSENAQPLKGMIKVAILYPNGEGKTFDMEYYASHHMPMLAEIYGDALKKLEIDKGISGRTPDDPIPFLAIGYLYFERIEDYREGFAPHAEKILSDIPNYTNIKPILQISKVVQ